MADKLLPATLRNADGAKGGHSRSAPAHVKLQRITCNMARSYPPDGLQREWWMRLKKTLGTASSDFVNASLIQLQTAARLPDSGISEIAVNAALAFIEGAKPRNEIEAALAIQMACTHAATMTVLGRLNSPGVGERRIAAIGSAAARLLQAYAKQVEVWRRLKNGGSQFVRVEHIHVSDGAQAVIGNIQQDPASQAS